MIPAINIAKPSIPCRKTYSTNPNQSINFGMSQDVFIKKALPLDVAIEQLVMDLEPKKIHLSSQGLDDNKLLGQLTLEYRVTPDNKNHILSLLHKKGQSSGSKTLTIGPKAKLRKELENLEIENKIKYAIDTFKEQSEKAREEI